MTYTEMREAFDKLNIGYTDDIHCVIDSYNIGFSLDDIKDTMKWDECSFKEAVVAQISMAAEDLMEFSKEVAGEQ